MIRVFFSIVFISVFSVGCVQSKAKEIQVVTADEVNTHIRYSTNLDKEIKSKDDFKKSHLVNAENIIENKDLKENFRNIDRESPVAIYFTSVDKSNEAALILRKLGFQQIYILDGGITKWKSED
ncbi:rhodanese-like domain-containing protein [Gillisia sp. CAL575]|uniref:rhodanese-like domain-containing protein n=1 Tax=Gillisia sp. CAL575 TaxID=985255 RepID=UPI0003A100A9|nr:rhodanese-like domain-containing protein [Gillisia sp. CAL575]